MFSCNEKTKKEWVYLSIYERQTGGQACWRESGRGGAHTLVPLPEWLSCCHSVPWWALVTVVMLPDLPSPPSPTRWPYSGCHPSPHSPPHPLERTISPSCSLERLQFQLFTMPKLLTLTLPSARGVWRPHIKKKKKSPPRSLLRNRSFCTLSRHSPPSWCPLICQCGLCHK